MSPVFVLNLVVQVRGTDGAPLKTMAVVTLYAPSGLPISTATTKGTQALFAQLAPGPYYVEVEAPGYWKAREEAVVQPTVADNSVMVSLAPAVAGSAPPVHSRTPLLVPEVQKELNKAVAALKANQLDIAERLFKSLLKRAPNHPDVLYVAGMLVEKKGHPAEAEIFWQKAVSFDPNHRLALYALGQSYLLEGNYAGAGEFGQKVLELDPNSWKAHNLLASVAFKEEHYADAVSHGERALELGKEQAAGVAILLAQALAVQGRSQEAIEVLNEFLAAKPEPRGAEMAEHLLELLRTAGDRFVIAKRDAEKTRSEPPEPVVSPLVEHWLPANVDEAVPAVEPGATCDLAEVLSKAGEQLQRLPEILDRFSATESVENQFVDQTGIALKAERFSFSYVVSIHETRHGHLNVEEYRNGNDEDAVFPDRFATRGLPSQVFVFHPYYQGDFDMSCEGLARHGAGFAWQVHFAQKENVPSRIQAHYLNGKRFAVPLKGRAWISATNFQVVQLQSDLREPLRSADLLAQHIDIEYGPVRFQKDNQELWLPIRAEFYSQMKSRRIHRRHDFHDYLLFAIEDKQNIGRPKGAPEP